MTDTDLRALDREIAEALGWTKIGPVWRGPDFEAHEGQSHVFCYSTDWNLCFGPIRAALVERGKWIDFVFAQVPHDEHWDPSRLTAIALWLSTATPADFCRAALAVLREEAG